MDIKPTPLRSVVAGSFAGAVEIAITYPFEFAKTRSQLNRQLPASQALGWPKFPSREWYVGCTTMVVGNAVKGGVGFVAFDSIKNVLVGPDGRLTPFRAVVAGFGAGVAESTFAVTPFESIKTQLVDMKQKSKSQNLGFIRGTRFLLAEKGPRVLLQGWVPTTARQAANSGVRFTSYTTLKQFFEKPGHKIGALGSFAIGATAGIITVYTTMSLDVIKTRMQSLQGRRTYGNSLNCARLIFMRGEPRTFWSGALARLGRLSLSGGIVFTMYEKTIEILDMLDPDHRVL
ncbi:MC family mitochondrial carrier protein [Cadophora sp. MPI-SDFR-AT-0126]|nr:MC family mitochondrial carrier protein [Leotiomycetes sp. MPI-SDFR-AT-0126]